MGDNGTGQYVGGTNSNSTNPQYEYNDCGAYYVTLIIIDDNGCNDTIQDSVYVYCLPNPNFSANPECQGDITSFIDASLAGAHPSAAIVAWNWTINEPGTYVNGTSSTDSMPEYRFDTCGFHDVTLEVTDTNGCVESITDTIEVWSLSLIHI